MANFKEVNKAIKANFPALKIEAVRGEGYVYFVGSDADDVESVYSHPVSTSTADMIDFCMSNIDEVAQAKEVASRPADVHYGMTEAQVRRKLNSSASFSGRLPLCASGSAHIDVTSDWQSVTCKACRDILKTRPRYL